MPRTLIQDYGPHKAGEAPEFDPVRTAWLEGNGYLEPEVETWPLKTSPAEYLEQREGEDPDTWSDAVRDRVELARRIVEQEDE